jgi:hypothetical protein
MSVIRLVTAGALLLALASAAWAERKQVDPISEWGGRFNDTMLKKEAPKNGVITDAKAFAKLWKAWRKDEKLPKVDFTKEFVVVTLASGPNSALPEFTLEGGHLKASDRQTLVGGDGFGYSLAVFSRKGVKKVNGRDLPKVKAKPEEPGE